MTLDERKLLNSRVSEALRDFKANRELNHIYNEWVIYPPYRYPETEREAVEMAVSLSPVTPKAAKEYLREYNKVNKKEALCYV